MPHSHAHHHHGKDQTIGRLWASIGLNTAIVVAEIIGGVISGSLSLISDGIHNLSDTSSLVISLVARKISGKKADEEKTFGYKRAEIIGAFINVIVLIVISLYLVYAAIERFIYPDSINGGIMFIVGIIAIMGNFSVVFLLAKNSRNSLNIKSAYIHFLADGLASIGVLLGGILIVFYQLYIIDPIITLGISGYILWQSYYMLRDTIDILMESTPREIDVEKVTRSLQTVEGVKNIHHIHVWRLDEKNILLESHVMIAKRELPNLETIKSSLKERLQSEFNIFHSTLEFEFEPCSELAEIPHH